MWHLTCIQCQASFTVEPRRGRKPGFCSDVCRLARRDCKECGERPARAGGLICNRCQYARRPRVPCSACGGPTTWTKRFGVDQSTVRCRPCTRGPNYRPSRNKRADGYVDQWTCAECGVACERPATKGQRPKYCATCRRVRRNPLITLAHSVRLAIYERDDWECQLCAGSVDRDLIGSQSHWRPSLDHVIPRSAGGVDEPSNLRLAHWWCNSVRGDGTYHADLFQEVS